MATICKHGNTKVPARPVPDWTGTCPDCGERVKHRGIGGFITVREVNAWLDQERRAVEEFRQQWRREHQLLAARPSTALSDQRPSDGRAGERS